jgi:hypothetical protein
VIGPAERERIPGLAPQATIRAALRAAFAGKAGVREAA